jgi:membrane protein DedA with SNARE-associated domain
MPFPVFFFYDGLSCLIQWLTVYLQAVFLGISLPNTSVEISLLFNAMTDAGDYSEAAAL